MAKTYNSPPNWPRPPVGWMPEPGWQPDPRWGPAPAGWQFWIEGASVDPAARAGMPSSADAHELRIFLSYRRTDCQPQANGLYDGLRRRLPDARVFMDIDGIPAGADFEEHIRREISMCDIVLVMIGDNWLDTRPGSDVRRIDEPADFVRLEVESALAHPQVDTLPVLVEETLMPSPTELPDSIARLARLQGVELSDRRWLMDLDHLVAEVEKIGVRHGKIAAPEQPPLAGPLPVQPKPAGPPRTPAMAYLLMFVPFLTIGLGAWIPALWAALKRDPGDPMRARLFVVTGVLGATSVAGAVFTSSIGGGLLLLAMVAGTTVAVAFRKVPSR